MGLVNFLKGLTLIFSEIVAAKPPSNYTQKFQRSSHFEDLLVKNNALFVDHTDRRSPKPTKPIEIQVDVPKG